MKIWINLKLNTKYIAPFNPNRNAMFAIFSQ